MAAGRSRGSAAPYLRQDGDAEGLADVRGPQINGQLGEEPPGRLPLHPARQLGAVPEPRREVLNLTEQRGELLLPPPAATSPRLRGRSRTSELRVMASTSALKTLTGRRSKVVPLSTMALSVLY